MPARVDENELSRRCRAISLLLLDVDGVLTDGVIAIDDNGVETKHFSVRDGLAIDFWINAGHRAAILSGRTTGATARRAAQLRIDPVIQGAGKKLVPFRRLLAEMGLGPDRVCYIGDDLPDLPVLAEVGLAACPADAAPEVREAAHYVAEARGGRGAVREIVEMLLKRQGKWDAVTAPHRPGPRGPGATLPDPSGQEAE